MKKFIVFINIIFTLLFFVACGEDRAATDTAETLQKSGRLGVLGVVDGDRDLDGLSDLDEVNIHHTDPDNADTDGDGVNDGDEVNIYHTNPNSADSDNDGLSDGLEINTYDTNATNADTDGDCLLDGFEILNYETNATNVDTDGDKVNDGIEIYSDVAGVVNNSCIVTPETLAAGANPNPAKDGIPDASTDVINALDPTNDSDGDGQSNARENNCTEGDPLDANKICPFLDETTEGAVLKKYGYTYVPGGFDVDGDGVNEGGFWMSHKQARSSGVSIPSESVITAVGNLNQFISRNFKVLNRLVSVTAYAEAPLSESNTVEGNELLFDEESIAGITRITGVPPYLALVELGTYKLKDENGTDLNISITMPTLKQYVHVQMLLKADLAHGGDGRHIRNGLLGTDVNVPLDTYSLIISEFGENYKEYLKNLVQLRETNTEEIIPIFSIEDLNTTKYQWWRINLENVEVSAHGGSLSTVDIQPYGGGLNADPYAVLVRGGESMDFRYGITGLESDVIGFRAATPYLY